MRIREMWCAALVRHGSSSSSSMMYSLVVREPSSRRFSGQGPGGVGCVGVVGSHLPTVLIAPPASTCFHLLPFSYASLHQLRHLLSVSLSLASPKSHPSRTFRHSLKP